MKTGLFAADSVKKGTRDLKVDLGYLITEDSTVYFDWFEITFDLTSEPQEADWKDSFIVYLVIGALIALPILALLGLVTIIRAVL